MFKTLQNAWKIPELRKKIIFTLFILLIYRVGNVIPVPYIDTATLASLYSLAGKIFCGQTIFNRFICMPLWLPLTI